MRRTRFGILAVTTAVFMAVTVPCAAGLMPAPKACTMEGCGDQSSLTAPRPSCCCAPAATQEASGSAALLLSKEVAAKPLAGQEFLASGTPASFETRELCISPPSPVPLFLLHSALLS